MRSEFYYQGHNREVASHIKNYLNAAPDLLSEYTARSPRAVGDALEALIADNFEAFAGKWCQEYSKDFARRAMADLAFTDTEGIYSVIDVKTHRENTQFNMPNLTSVERLARFYESDSNVFSLMMISYVVQNTKIVVSDVLFYPIEFLDWECLAIGALGWGQIQIRNSKNIRIRDRYSRKQWMLEFCAIMEDYYPKEIGKIQKRMERFERIRSYWEAKEDIWT